MRGTEGGWDRGSGIGADLVVELVTLRFETPERAGSRGGDVRHHPPHTLRRGGIYGEGGEGGCDLRFCARSR